MKMKDVVVGEKYVAKISGKLTVVKLTGLSPYGGWDAVNTTTNRRVRIRSAAKLRRKVQPKLRTAEQDMTDLVAFADGSI